MSEPAWALPLRVDEAAPSTEAPGFVPERTAVEPVAELLAPTEPLTPDAVLAVVFAALLAAVLALTLALAAALFAALAALLAAALAALAALAACVWAAAAVLAAAALAEIGATAHEIAAVSGHMSLDEIERYTRTSRKRKLPDTAIAKLK